MQPAQTTSPSVGTLTAGLKSATFKKPFPTQISANNIKLATADKSIKPQATKPGWLHTPHAEDAIVLNKGQWQKAGEKGSTAVLPVVVDPHVGRNLRPHQAQGVQFLYECIMGLRETNRQAHFVMVKC